METIFFLFYMFVKFSQEGAVILKCENYTNIFPFWVLSWSLKEQAPRQYSCMPILSSEKPTSSYGIAFKIFFFFKHNLEIRISCKQKSGSL